MSRCVFGKTIIQLILTNYFYFLDFFMSRITFKYLINYIHIYYLKGISHDLNRDGLHRILCTNANLGTLMEKILVFIIIYLIHLKNFLINHDHLN